MKRLLYCSPLLILLLSAFLAPQCKGQGHAPTEKNMEATDDDMTFDWKTPYQPMTFDLLHRGTFNTSKCNAEMMNCWEIISPTMVCESNEHLGKNWYPHYYGSICSIMHEYCQDFIEDDIDNGGTLKMREGHCHYYNVHTRRFNGFQRDRTYDPLTVHLTD